jgi:hypothetical protein
MDASSLLKKEKKIFKATGGATASSQGASSDIETLWDEQIWTPEVIMETQIWLLIVLKNKDNNNNISIVNVYMPNSYKDKMATCNSLSELRNSIDLSSYIIGGDLNTHINPGEKKRGVAKSETLFLKIFPTSYHIGTCKTSNPQKEITHGKIDVLALVI